MPGQPYLIARSDPPDALSSRLDIDLLLGIPYIFIWIMDTFDVSRARLEDYRYHILIASYRVITSLAILRVNRQPYSWRIKVEQIEPFSKGLHSAL